MASGSAETDDPLSQSPDLTLSTLHLFHYKIHNYKLRGQIYSIPISFLECKRAINTNILIPSGRVIEHIYDWNNDLIGVIDRYFEGAMQNMSWEISIDLINNQIWYWRRLEKTDRRLYPSIYMLDINTVDLSNKPEIYYAVCAYEVTADNLYTPASNKFPIISTNGNTPRIDNFDLSAIIAGQVPNVFAQFIPNRKLSHGINFRSSHQKARATIGNVSMFTRFPDYISLLEIRQKYLTPHSS